MRLRTFGSESKEEPVTHTRYHSDNADKTGNHNISCMTTTIRVEGMSCEHCEQTIEEAIRGVTNVSDAHVDRETEMATVEGDPDTADLVQAVEDAGYTAHA